VLLVPLAALALVETPRRRDHFDVAGALGSTLGVTALVYAFVRVGADGWRDHLALGAFGLGVVLLAGYIGIEAKVSAPVTPLRLFTSRERNTAYLGRILLMGGTQGTFFFLTQYLQDVRGYSAIVTGVGFLPMTAVVFVMSQATARWLVNLAGRKTLILIGMTFSAAGMLWLAQLNGHSGFLAFLGPTLAVGLGNGLAFVPLTTSAIHGVEPRDASAASGLLNVTQQVGGALGLAILVTAFGSSSRQAHSPAGTPAAAQAAHAFTVGATHAFYYAAIFLTVAFVATAVLMRNSPAEQAPSAPPQPEPAAEPALVAD
jgi:MFS family permease